MKQTLLKNGLPFAAMFALFLIVFHSCTKQQFGISDDLQTTESIQNTNLSSAQIADTNPFKKTTGAPIEVATGNKWIENFKKLNRGMGKEYVMAVKDLQAILSNPSCVGICLYFAIDEKQQAHLLPIGVSSKGYLMKTATINTSVGSINWEMAQKWIANDPGEIDARFFGSNTFDRLFNTTNCTKIKAISALDDSKKPQLLLANASLNYQDVNMQGSTLLRYEDDSAVCPPVCPLAQ
jgi:hypothetical protein